MWNKLGYCFLCSERVWNSEKVGDYSETVYLLHNFLQNLNIDKQIATVFGNPHSRKSGDIEKIKVELCELCKRNCARLSVLFTRLEKVQMEISYYLDDTQKRISDSAKQKSYTKRMTTDSEALKQREFVENLRKEILNKRMKNVRIPRVCITLTNESMSSQNIPNIKVECEGLEEVADTTDIGMEEESIEDAYESIPLSPSTTESQPPSPQSASDQEQSSKTTQEPSTSTNQCENDRMIHSMKLLAAQITKLNRKSKSSEFFTKDLATGKYNCRKCEKASECRTTIEKHFKSVHLKRKYNCDICNVATFTQSGHLAAHKKTCAQKLVMELAKEKDPKFSFICNRCGNRFETSKKLRAHEKSVHENANRYVCDACGKMYSSYNNLRLHNEVIHLSRKLSCKRCNKMYKDEGKFKKHEKNCSNPTN